MRLTWIIMAICLIVFIYEFFLGLQGGNVLDNFFNDFGFSLQNIIEGKFWIFFTSLFLHADAEHLVLNMIALFFFGKVVEEELGWRKYILIFFISAFIGEFALMFTTFLGLMPAAIPTVGASGAIFGLLGAAMFVKPLEFVFYPYLVPVPLILVAILYTLYNLAAFVLTIALGQISQVAYIAHIGGLAGGIFFGLKEAGKKKSLMILMLILILLVLIPFIWYLFEYLELTNYITVITGVFK